MGDAAVVPLRLIVSGTREFEDKDFLFQVLDHWVAKYGKPAWILSGRAYGPDRMGELWAGERGVLIRHFEPDWKQFGPAAGPIRNGVMADNADALVSFWNGESSGTRDMIDKAQDKGLKIDVVIVRCAARRFKKRRKANKPPAIREEAK